MALSCPKCGSELPGTATVCGKCGTSFDFDFDKIAVEGDLAGADASAFNSGALAEFAGAAETGEAEYAEFHESSSSSLGGVDESYDDIEAAIEAELLNYQSGENEEDGENGENGESGEDAEKAENAENSQNPENGKQKKPDTPLKRMARKVLSVVVILAIGFGLGFGFNIFRERGMSDVFLNEIGYKAVKLINEELAAEQPGSTFIAHDIYVKQEIQVTECVIFGVIFTDLNDREAAYYRLLFDNSDASDVKIFHPFNREHHNSLRQGDERERLRADMMMNNYENFLRSVSEIIAGDERWSRASAEHINMRLLKESRPGILDKVRARFGN